ncbi:hypothetical protein I5V54_21610 [Stenotrophomonas maltophilia]|nr:hypothetical protein [Stenotrophomonas maltophilia]MBH1846333.1 hypothetical protein [Stenotrophomonas maltophilia]
MRYLFSELCNLLGQRIDSDPVLSIAERIGAKEPKPTSFAYSNSVGGMSHRPTGLEISWSHEVLAPEYYPPRKSGRHFVCWVDSIWFDPATVDNLPLQLSPTSLAEDLVEAAPQLIVEDMPKRTAAMLTTRPDCVLALPSTPRRWQIKLAQMHRYSLPSYAAAGNDRPGQNSNSDRWEYWDQATAFFLYWCILRGFASERHTSDHGAEIQNLHQQRMSVMDYIRANCFEGELWSWDIREPVRHFTYIYFHALCNRNSAHPGIGRPDRCHPNDDLSAVVNHLSKCGVPNVDDEWRLFRHFSTMLDARWKDYLLTGLQTEVSRRQTVQLTAMYRKMVDNLSAASELS